MRRILVGIPVPCFAALAGSVVVALGADQQRLELTPKVGEGGVGHWAIYRSIIKRLRLTTPGNERPIRGQNVALMRSSRRICAGFPLPDEALSIGKALSYLQLLYDD